MQNILRLVISLMLVLYTSASVHAAAQPISGIDISAKKNPGGVRTTVKTNSNGVFILRGLENGTYDVWVGTTETPDFVQKFEVKKGELFGRLSMHLSDEVEQPVFFKKGVWDEDRVIVLKAIMQHAGALKEVSIERNTVGALRAELVALQRKFGLPATGVLGDMTVKKLNSFIKYADGEQTDDTESPTGTSAAKKKSYTKILKESGLKCTGCMEWYHDR